MCGPDNSNRPRGGALAALTPPKALTPSSASSTSSETSFCAESFEGDLTFHTPGRPKAAAATHARFTPIAPLSHQQLRELQVVVHSFGDLTRSVQESGHFCEFSIPTPSKQGVPSNAYVELSLEDPLALEVGDRGVIGRRVSLFQRDRVGLKTTLVAEGIVGFNM